MRFRFTAPVCTERIKVSYERHVIDYMLSVDSADCGRGGFCSGGVGGNCGSGSRGCEGRRMTVEGGGGVGGGGGCRSVSNIHPPGSRQ